METCPLSSRTTWIVVFIMSQNAQRENAGTTSLGALLRAKLDNN